MCKDSLWERVAAFHGHVCPGLAIGYKVAEIALESLAESRAEDEQIIAIVENDACGIDAIMVMTGCTLGKGNLIFKDTGKQVYTFCSRTANRAIRISVNSNRLLGAPGTRELQQRVMDGIASDAEQEELGQIRQMRIDSILMMPAGEFATVRKVDFDAPSRARLFPSVQCSACGEYAMEPRTRNQDGGIVCLDCFDDYSRIINKN